MGVLRYIIATIILIVLLSNVVSATGLESDASDVALGDSCDPSILSEVCGYVPIEESVVDRSTDVLDRFDIEPQDTEDGIFGLFETLSIDDPIVQAILTEWDEPSVRSPSNLVEDGLGTGCTEMTKDEFIKAVESGHFVTEVDDPEPCDATYVDLSSFPYFPMVGDQGNQNSCSAWAMTYYCLGYQVARANGWTDACTGNDNHLLSPAYTYNRLNHGTDSGSNRYKNGLVQKEWGAPTMSCMPYDDDDHLSWGDELAQRSAPLHKASEAFNIPWDGDCAWIRSAIEDGVPVCFSIDSHQYNTCFLDDYCISSTEYSSTITTHAQTIVGYDDYYIADGEQGAFKIVNSWGTDWGDDGYYWITYDAMNKIASTCSYTFYFSCVIDETSNEHIVALLNFNYAPSRDSEIHIGLGDPGNPTADKTFEYEFDSSNRMPSFMALDISDLCASATDGQKVYVKIDSGDASGKLTSFKVETFSDTEPYIRYPRSATMQSPTVPDYSPILSTNYLDLTYEGPRNDSIGYDGTTYGGGMEFWLSVDDKSTEGDTSVRSGAIGDGQCSRISYKVEGPCFVSFDWKVSSEENYDFLEFMIDFETVESITGEVEDIYSVQIPDGAHWISWQYTKDSIYSDGWDCGWMDNLEVDDDPADWTIMVYMDGDNNLEGSAIDDFLEIAQIGSDENVRFVVQMDRIDGYDTSYGDWTGCNRYVVTKDMTPTMDSAAVSLGEVNMGDQMTLRSFIQWGIDTCPAENYMVVLWDHGGGYYGVCWDSTNSNDNLELSELSSAMSGLTFDNGKSRLDILGFDACLMASLEVADQIDELAEYAVFSEEYEPGDGWPYQTICDTIVDNPTMSSQDFAKWIVTWYLFSYMLGDQSGPLATLSAMDLDETSGVVNAVGLVADHISNNMPGLVNYIANARDSTQQYSMDDMCDLHDLMVNIGDQADIAGDNDLALLCSNAITALDQAIVSEAHWNESGSSSSVLDSHGLSICFPEVGDAVSSGYSTNEFAARGWWVVMLEAFEEQHSLGNSCPTMTFTPSPGNHSIYEGNDFLISIVPNDPDGNLMNITWYLNGEVVLYDSTYVGLHTILDEYGTITIAVRLFDGLCEVEYQWVIVVMEDDIAPDYSIEFPDSYWHDSDVDVHVDAWDNETWVDHVNIYYKYCDDNLSWAGATMNLFIEDLDEPYDFTFPFNEGRGYYRIYVGVTDAGAEVTHMETTYTGPTGYLPLGFGQKDWTVLVYMDGDNNLQSAAFDDFMEISSVGSTSDVDMVVLMDRFDGNAAVYHIQNGMDYDYSNSVDGSYELDMGEEYTLECFVRQGVLEYPAENYMLVLWDHGAGWYGACVDETSSNDILTLDEIRAALSDAEGITNVHLDIVGFDACSMATIEVVDALDGLTDHVIFSQMPELGDGWYYPWIMQNITSDSGITPDELCSCVVESYVDSYRLGLQYGDNVTMSAFDVNTIAPLYDEVDDLASFLLGDMGRYSNMIAMSQHLGQRFEGDSDFDLYDVVYTMESFADDYIENELGPSADDVVTLRAKCRAIMSTVLTAQIDEGSHSDEGYLKWTTGLSIYWPTQWEGILIDYEDTRFAQGTSWDEMLTSYHGNMTTDVSPEFVTTSPSGAVDMYPTETQTFQGEASDADDSVLFYLWYLDDELVDYGQTFDLTPTMDDIGTHVIELQVTDLGQNDSSRITTNWTVEVLQDDVRPQSSIEGSHGFFHNSSVTISVTASDDATGIGAVTLWYEYGQDNSTFSDWASFATSDTGPWTFEFTFPEGDGYYVIGSSATDGFGNVEATHGDLTLLYDATAPTIDLSIDSPLLVLTPVTFNATASDDLSTIVSYSWDLDGTKYEGAVIVHSFETIGYHTVSLTLVDICGNVVTDVVNVDVYDDVVPIADAGDDVTIELGATVELDGGASADNYDIGEYSWNMRDDVTLLSSEESFEMTFDTIGVFHIVLTVTDVSGNSANDTVVITVVDTESPVADAGDDATFPCSGSYVLSGIGSTDNDGIVGYAWDLPGSDWHADTMNVTVQGLVPGEYTYTLTVTDASGNEGSDDIVLTVYDDIVPVADAGDDITVEQGSSIHLDASGSTDNVGIVNYTWVISGPSGSSYLYGVSMDFPFAASGDFTVTLTVRDAEGNEGCDALRVTVEPAPDNDGDGVPDSIDDDDDNDGVIDTQDLDPFDPDVGASVPDDDWDMTIYLAIAAVIAVVAIAGVVIWKRR